MLKKIYSDVISIQKKVKLNQKKINLKHKRASVSHTKQVNRVKKEFGKI
ncbi:hypothetical protein R0H03_06070 [Pediococcus acidilactici]|uniref:Uncharacterized protein n=1 Tax=Pediococcus acidilactici TaxID=1254 RepID=A0AAW8YMQ3_PEDAC|nr:hypothetical protein [Pediococcus acidilactici]MDV2911425.1 hypothetical protein [Pediococcus acidilactici]WQS17196.1 hypothetical protein SGW14_09265 [Pediococcus acidilactici]